MKRPPVDVVMMSIADCLSTRGMCNRLKVAAVIVNDRRIITSGVNGPNTWDCDELHCDVEKPCQHSIHAEANAIMFARKNNINLEGTTLYITHSPCIDCAKLIAESGIVRVVYGEPFRSMQGVEYLKTKLILTEEFNVESLPHNQNQ